MLGSSSKSLLILLLVFMLLFCAVGYTSKLMFPKILQDLCILHIDFPCLRAVYSFPMLHQKFFAQAITGHLSLGNTISALTPQFVMRQYFLLSWF